MCSKQKSKLSKKIGFIGCGSMAIAISEVLVKQGFVTYADVAASGYTTRHMEAWTQKGAFFSTNNIDIVEKSDVIFIAVKPQKLEAAAASIVASEKTKNKLFVSVLAGVKIETLRKNLGHLKGARIVRVMPNTPMMVGEGCSVFCPDDSATADDVQIVETILAASGRYQRVAEEMINAVGAMTGSGPAFIYLVIESMADGAVRMGVPRAMATEFAAQTVLGSGRMVLETGRHPGQLKDEVCSPGGTTITGMHELERAGVRAAFMNAIEAATKRSWELD